MITINVRDYLLRAVKLVAWVETILGRALEATPGIGKERFSVEGIVWTVGDNKSCEKDMVRGIYNKDGLQNNILVWMLVVISREGDEN